MAMAVCAPGRQCARLALAPLGDRRIPGMGARAQEVLVGLGAGDDRVAAGQGIAGRRVVRREARRWQGRARRRS